jgi:hypothetical protein
MNNSITNHQSPKANHLSPGEWKILRKVREDRAEHRRRSKHGPSVSRRAKSSLLVAACSAGLFWGTPSVRGSEDPAVSMPELFNQANAAQRAGRLGPAILGYERALQLAPRDPAVAQNLRIAREKAGVSAPVVSAWQRPAHALGLDGLAVLASIALGLFGLLAMGMMLIPAGLRGFARGLRAAMGATALLAGSAVALRWSELDRAVIQATRATAHIAPAEAAAAAFELKAGELVTARREHGDFILVSTPDRRSGWVARAEVERILPPAVNPSPM